MALEVDIEGCLGAFSLDVRFAGEQGVTALFGHSGAGKSSVINMIAGLARPRRGRIAIDGRVLFDSTAGIDLPARKRRIGYVFQDSRLFPHLKVRANLAYGRRFTPPDQRHADFGHIVELLGIGHLLDRRPPTLSGGERQRVAIGRALLTSPRLLLMDEPLASLDAARKAEILPWIERLRDELALPIVYVSHQFAEVVRLADQLVVLADGRVTAAGKLGEVAVQPALAEVIGAARVGTVLEARIVRHEDVGLTLLDSAAGRLHVPQIDLPEGAGLRVRLLASDVAIATRPPDGLSIQNSLPARITAIDEETASSCLLHLQAADAELLARVTCKAVQDLDLVPGRDVHALVKSVAVMR